MSSRLPLCLCSFGLQTCLVARRFGLERGIKDLAVNTHNPLNGMHSALFKVLSAFEITSPIKSEWVQKPL